MDDKNFDDIIDEIIDNMDEFLGKREKEKLKNMSKEDLKNINNIEDVRKFINNKGKENYLFDKMDYEDEIVIILDTTHSRLKLNFININIVNDNNIAIVEEKENRRELIEKIKIDKNIRKDDLNIIINNQVLTIKIPK